MTPPEIETPQLFSPEQLKARDRRNKALAGVLFFFVALVFVITIARYYTNVHHGL